MKKLLAYSAILLLSLFAHAGKRELLDKDTIASKRQKLENIGDSSSESDEDEDEAFIEIKLLNSFDSIIDVLNPFIEEEKQILLVLDWDNTMTLENGKNVPLREGATTKEVFVRLQELGVKTIVLTSRLNGQSLQCPGEYGQEIIKEAINYTLVGPKENDIDIKKSGALGDNSYEEFQIEHTDCHVVIQDQFVFAGPYKGEALMEILSSPRLACAPDVIVFVDDQMANIESVEASLKDTNYSGILFYYPESNKRTGIKINELCN